MRIINKEKFDAHTDPIFKELKIVNLGSRNLLFHLGKFMYVFKNNLLPRTFGNLILRTNQVHYDNIRSSNQSLLMFLYEELLRRGGLVVNALDFRSGGRWFEPDLCRRVVSLDKKPYSTLFLFTQGYKWVPAIIMLGGNLAMA